MKMLLANILSMNIRIIFKVGNIGKIYGLWFSEMESKQAGKAGAPAHVPRTSTATPGDRNAIITRDDDRSSQMNNIAKYFNTTE